jgi:hypothetical protein
MLVGVCFVEVVIAPDPQERNLNYPVQVDQKGRNAKHVVKERCKKIETPINKEIKNFYSIVTLN